LNAHTVLTVSKLLLNIPKHAQNDISSYNLLYHSSTVVLVNGFIDILIHSFSGCTVLGVYTGCLTTQVKANLPVFT